jgi:hypothetical protein
MRFSTWIAKIIEKVDEFSESTVISIDLEE